MKAKPKLSPVFLSRIISALQKEKKTNFRE